MAKWMPFSSRPGIVQIARLLGAAGEQDGVEIARCSVFDRHVHADVRVGDERRHLRRASARGGDR